MLVFHVRNDFFGFLGNKDAPCHWARQDEMLVADMASQVLYRIADPCAVYEETLIWLFTEKQCR